MVRVGITPASWRQWQGVGRASAGHRVGLAADAPLPGCDHESARRRKLAANPQATGGRPQARRHQGIISTLALVPRLGRPTKHQASTLAGRTPRGELAVAGSGDTGSLDTGSLRAHGLAIGPGLGSCRRHGGMERWWGGGADDRAVGPKGPKAPRPTPETSDVAFTRSSRRPSCSRSGSTQAACRPTRLFTGTGRPGSPPALKRQHGMRDRQSRAAPLGATGERRRIQVHR
jgi:hypothetical protein